MRNCWVSDNFIGINVPKDPGQVKITGNNNWVKNNCIGQTFDSNVDMWEVSARKYAVFSPSDVVHGRVCVVVH